MTIQYMPEKNMVRVADRFFPVAPREPHTYNAGVCYFILIGDTGKSLSIAVGCDTYSDNRDYPFHGPLIDISIEFEEVEVGFDFGRPVWKNYFGTTVDVRGWINDKQLLEMIEKVLNGQDPFRVETDFPDEEK